MASVQVVETSATNNSPSQASNHPDDLFQSRYVTPGSNHFLRGIFVNMFFLYKSISLEISPPPPKEIIHLSFIELVLCLFSLQSYSYMVKSEVRIVKTNYSLSDIHYINGNIYILVNITKKSKLTRQYPSFKDLNFKV